LPADEQLHAGGGESAGDDWMTGGARYDSDLAPFKPRADLLLVGSCHAPGNEPVTSCRVTAHVGSRSRSLHVLGDRFWKRNALGLWKMTDSEAFRTMELGWENSFGGEDYEPNPVGKGYGEDVDEAGNRLRPLPNIEDPTAPVTSPRDRPDPVGFGPLHPSWQQRQSLVGTYDRRYLEERWPWFPEDFDWGHFNAAPPEMQVEGYLRGDEELYFENLHPEHPQYRSQLPGERVRCFVNRRLEDESDATTLDEVPMNLDTLWVDMEAEQLVLLWRGWTEVLSEDCDEIEDLFVMSEPVNEDAQSGDECRGLFLAAAAEEERQWGLAPEVAPEEVEVVTDAGVEAPEADADVARDEETARPKLEVRQSLEKQSAALMAQLGIDLDTLPPEVRQKTLEQQATMLDRLTEDDPQKAMAAERARLDAEMKQQLGKLGIDPNHPPPLSDKARAEQLRFFREIGIKESDLAADPDLGKFALLFGAMLPKMGVDAEDLSPLIAETRKRLGPLKESLSIEEDIEEPAEGDEAETAALLTREIVQERAARGEAFAGEELHDLDLSGLELAGIDFSGALFPGSALAGADLAAANLSNADLDGVDLSEAKLTGAALAGAKLAAATLERADLTDADLSEADLTDAKLADATLTDAIFDGSKMAGAILDRAAAADASFTEADLTGASLGKADLSRADLSGCLLHRASFRGANLTETRVEGAAGTGVDFSGANLTGLRAAEGCDFSHGSFRQAMAHESIWHGARLVEADFSYARMQGADFSGAAMESATLYAADMTHARFRRTDLRGASLVEMKLFEASLERADLTGTDLGGSNLYGAELLDAVLEDTNLEGANLKGTKLHG